MPLLSYTRRAAANNRVHDYPLKMGGIVAGVGGWMGGYRVGGVYSPVNGAAGPLTRRPGAAGLQISAHAHICTEEQPGSFAGEC